MNWIDGCDFPLTEDERAVQEVARVVAREKVLPRAREIDEHHEFPADLVPELAKLGFFGPCAPEEIGGSGLSTVAYALIIEELAAACASTAIIVSAHNSLCLTPILHFGSQEQIASLGPTLVSGSALGCFALSEPGMGSDAASVKCSARRDGDNFIINGVKNWITNGPVAGICILIAMEDPTLGHKGITAFVHPMNLPGITLGKREDKLGIRGSPTCSISYDNVILSQEHVLGGSGQGFKVAMATLNGGRIGVAAQAIGIARAALADALSYGKERKSFNKLIVEHQSIQNYLADLIVGIDGARYLTLGAARRKDAGLNYIRQASMAKLAASKIAVEAGDKCVQIHGGYGYVTDYPAERHLRDAKITEIYEGTSEIQRLIIASQLVKEHG